MDVIKYYDCSTADGIHNYTMCNQLGRELVGFGKGCWYDTSVGMFFSCQDTCDGKVIRSTDAEACIRHCPGYTDGCQIVGPTTPLPSTTIDYTRQHDITIGVVVPAAVFSLIFLLILLYLCIRRQFYFCLNPGCLGELNCRLCLLVNRRLCKVFAVDSRPKQVNHLRESSIETDSTDTESITAEMEIGDDQSVVGDNSDTSSLWLGSDIANPR